MKKTKSRASGRTAPTSVNAYLASIPEPARSTLNKIRAAIQAALPAEATEGISYGIPTFKLQGPLVWFAAFSKHCSFFPGSSVIEAFREELKAFPTSKGTIRFPVDRPLPAALLKKMVRARLAEIEARRSGRQLQPVRQGSQGNSPRRKK